MLAGIVTLLTRKHEQNLSTFSHFILIRASYWHLHTHFKLLTHVIHLNLTHVKRILINLRQKVNSNSRSSVLRIVGEAWALQALLLYQQSLISIVYGVGPWVSYFIMLKKEANSSRSISLNYSISLAISIWLAIDMKRCLYKASKLLI